MFNKMKTAFLSILNNNSKKKLAQKGLISFLFDKVLFFALLIFINFLVLFGLNSMFGIQIKRFFMLTIVSVSELILILSNKNSYFDDKFEVVPQRMRTSKEYNNGLLFYGYKNLVSNLYLVLPFLLAYGIFRDANFLFYFNSILTVFALPILSMVLLSILPHFKNSSSKILIIFRNLLAGILSFLFYFMICYGMKINLNFSYPLNAQYTNYTSLANIINLPLYLTEILQVDIFEILTFIINISAKNYFNVLIFTSFVFSFVVVFVCWYFVLRYENLKTNSTLKTKYINIRKNNTKVFRINHTIKYCLPRSPTSKQTNYIFALRVKNFIKEIKI